MVDDLRFKRDFIDSVNMMKEHDRIAEDLGLEDWETFEEIRNK